MTERYDAKGLIPGLGTLWLALSKDRYLCDSVAQELEIQADGGDDDGAFVQEIAKEVYSKMKNSRIQEDISKLEAMKPLS